MPLRNNIVIRSLRLLFLPFPFAFAVCMATIQLVDNLLHPDRGNIHSGEAGEYIGQFLFFVLIGFLQLSIGIPSLLTLDDRRCGIAPYVSLGAGVALSMSVFFAALFRAPQFGETLSWMFSRVLLFFGIPIFTGYLLAFYLRRPHEPKVA